MRKRKPKKRIINPDPRFADSMVTQFVNMMMLDGKKTTSFDLFYAAMDKIAEKSEDSPHDVWKAALKNVMPAVEVRSKRIGGATFQIPTEIRANRKISIGMKWMIKYSRLRSGKGMAEKLAAEILAASKGEGAAVKKREDTHRMAEANRAFAHFKA